MCLEGIQVFSLSLHTLRRVTFKNKHPIFSSSELAVKHRMGEDRVGRSHHFTHLPHTVFSVGGFKVGSVHARTSLSAWLMLCFSALCLYLYILLCCSDSSEHAGAYHSLSCPSWVVPESFHPPNHGCFGAY